MRRKVFFSILGVLLTLLVPAIAAAQGDDSDDSFILRVQGTVTVAAEERINTVVVINGDAIVEGTVDDTLVVVSGDATISGEVDDVVVVDGTLTLRQGSTVGDVTTYRSELTQEEGATITGELTESDNLPNVGVGAGIFTLLSWIAVTLVILVAGLIFAAFGGRQLGEAAMLLTERPLQSILAALVVWIGLPILGVLVLLTVIGIPLGLAILFVVLPVLWLAGYIVACARFGSAALDALTRTPPMPEHPYLAVVIGVLTFQLLTLVPIFGGLVVGLLGFFGAGALVYRWFIRLRGQRPEPGPAMQPETGPV